MIRGNVETQMGDDSMLPNYKRKSPLFIILTSTTSLLDDVQIYMIQYLLEK